MSMRNAAEFLPVCRADMKRRSWDELDFLCIVGDAYVDHPSFGHAIVSRFLESRGYRVGIVAQPDWRARDDFERMGRPRLGVLVSAGNLDSMLSNYSAPGKRRAKDDYAPGGRAGLRPDRATLVYCNRVREIWQDIPLIIGGIEASLRRVAHYDWWSDEVRRSIMIDSRADLLIYGMAEYALERVADLLFAGTPVGEIRDVPGTCWKTRDANFASDASLLPSFDEVRGDRRLFAEAYNTFYNEQNFASGKRLIQDQGSWLLVQNPPAPPLSSEALDRIYSLPYARSQHPSYDPECVPALNEVQFGLVSHRGCFGGCAFCAIALHQGRVIQTRGEESIVEEARLLTTLPGFKGYINDVGGPTANFRDMPCPRQADHGACKDKACLYPKPCPNMRPSHASYLRLLKRLRTLPGVKKVFIRSGLRYDYILSDPKGGEFLRELCLYHVSGQLKIAPEHASDTVLARMRKPSREVTERFVRQYRDMNARLGKRQFLVPYLMSGHPGCGLAECLELAEFCRDLALRPEQVQEFAPTPGTPATCMYHTGLDPFTLQPVYVPRDKDERAMQRALLQYWRPENRRLVEKALSILGRRDLIGDRQKCLIRKSRGHFSDYKR